MSKDEMIEEVANLIYSCQSKEDCTGGHCDECLATALINLGYRKVGEDEIVVKKGDVDYITELYREALDKVEKWRHLCELKIKETKQETAREILQELYDEAMRNTNEVVELTAFEIKQLAKEKGIELEKNL